MQKRARKSTARLIAMVSGSDDYRIYLNRAAETLVGLPQTVMSTITDWSFRQLGPEVYLEVRAGAEKFNLPAQRVYDGLFEVLKAVALRGYARRWAKQQVRRQAALFALLRFNLTLPYRWKQLKGPEPETPEDFPYGSSAIDPPLASIELLSFNRLEYLRTTLFSFCQTVKESRHELIAVDNGSSDGSREFLEEALRRGWISRALLLDTNLGVSDA